jgi:hypothetical protein
MAKHAWSILAEQVLVDRFTNSTTIFGVLEEVEVQQGPEPLTSGAMLPVKGVVVSTWVRSDDDVPEESRIHIVLVAPDGRTIASKSDQSIDLRNGRRHRSLLHFEGFVFLGAGTYEFVVQHRSVQGEAWEQAARLPLVVKVSNRAP